MKINLQVKLVVIVLILTTRIYSQNLIPNSSFEDNKVIHPNSPDASNQIEYMQDWGTIKTSDWFGDIIGQFNGFYDPISTTFDGNPTFYSSKQYAHTGNKFIGFGSCEAVKVKLTDKTEKMHWVVVSFWFSPRGKCDTKINTYIMEDEAGDNALDNCQTPNFSYSLHFEMDINATGIDQEHIPGNWYFYQSQPMLVTEECEWIAIKGSNDNISGDGSDPNFMFIDDVSVTTLDFCDHICTNSGGDIEATNIIPNAMIGNSGLNFFTTFENANRLEFRVFNEWGCLIYESINYDPSGLIDPGYPDFAIVWNGNKNVISSCNTTLGDVYYPELYNITIDGESCIGNDFHYIGDLTVVDIYSPPAIPYASTKITNPPDCCPEYQYYQNVTFTVADRTDVDDFITAGSNVTSGATGPVIVSSGADVEFYAGNSINLMPGFSIDPGGNFSAVIEACAVTPRALLLNADRAYYEELRANANVDLLKPYSARMKIFPNPSSGIFTISGLENSKETIQDTQLIVTDIIGNVVYKCEASNESISIDLSDLSKGIYFIKVEDLSGKVQIEKIIIE